jgi:Mn2+/Fe2+ NRAMP family transporter
MTPQQWLGLAAGLFIGAAYGVIQRRCMGGSLQPEAASRSSLWAVARLTALMATVFIVLRVTDADRILLVVGVMVSYGLMFGMTMMSVFRNKSR